MMNSVSILDYASFLLVPFIICTFYYKDLSGKNNLSYTRIYNPHNKIFYYLLAYFLIGFSLYIYIDNNISFGALNSSSSIKKEISVTPYLLKSPLKIVIVACTIRGFLSGKIIPISPYSVDGFINQIFFKNLKEDIVTDNYSSKVEFAEKVIKDYKEIFSTDLTLEILGNKLITYHIQNKITNPKVHSLTKDLPTLDTLHKGVMSILNANSPRRVKSIVFKTKLH